MTEKGRKEKTHAAPQRQQMQTKARFQRFSG
jgi:hypothetical protein